MLSIAMRALAVGLGLVTTSLSPFSSSVPVQAPSGPPGVAAAQNDAAQRYGNLPMTFEANRGQAADDVSYLARGAGYSLYLTPKGAVLSLRPSGPERAHASAGPRSKTQREPEAALRMTFVGANADAVVAGLDPQASRSNYLIGPASDWIRDVPHFGKVLYRNVYAGVDVLYYGNQRQLEYDFVVAPGADPSQIRMKFDGADGIRVDRNGDLVLASPQGDLFQRKPVIYQETDGARRTIEGQYIVHDDGRVAIEVGEYDRDKALVIDPILSYSTYLGGNDHEIALAVAVDASGNAYVAGYTYSSNYPVVGGTPDINNSIENVGFVDAFVTKLNPTGSAVVYSTYFGGDGADTAYGIAVTASGKAWITGVTGSSDLPVTNAYQSNNAGGDDVFVAQLNASGNALLSVSYLGGSANDRGRDIAVDASGNAYVTGYVESSNFPVTEGALQPFRRGIYDGFVAKFSAAGSGLLYSTYLGGSSNSEGTGIAVDGAGRAVVAGYTYANDFPTHLPLQAVKGGEDDVFVSKLDAAGTSLVYSTFLGGSLAEYVGGVALDAAGNVYLAGTTRSANFPIVLPWQDALRGSSDAFVAKINAAGSALLYSTYVGGASDDNATDIAVDAFGSAVIAGTTTSTNFPVSASVSRIRRGGEEGFVLKMKPQGQGAIYGTYIGGSSNDYVTGVAVDAAGNAIVAGGSYSSDFTLASAWQSTFKGVHGNNGDAFVFKLVDPGLSSWQGDFNGDGRADVLWRNQATGANAVWYSGNPATSAYLVSAGAVWQIAGIGDFNGDDKSDVLWRNRSTGGNGIWLSGNANTPYNLIALSSVWIVAGIGDFDADHKSDILWRNPESGVNAIWRSGNPTTVQSLTSLSGYAWSVVGIGDFDGDHRADILWRNADTGANGLWRAGNGATAQALTPLPDSAWQVANIGDFDGDNRDDILWRNSKTNSSGIWKSANSGTPQNVTTLTVVGWHIASVADYNGDGKADILWRSNSTGANIIWPSAKSESALTITPVATDWAPKS